MDAGAGSGNLTKILADIVPHGQIYAVDSDHNMVQHAKSNLSVCTNVQVILEYGGCESSDKSRPNFF